MQQKKIPFEQLEEAVLSQLKSQNYMDSTLHLYQVRFARIQEFLSARGSQYYCPEAGQAFLASLHLQRSTMSGYVCTVRRLDDFLAGRPYRCHHGGEVIQLSECYAGALDDYLSECREAGNRLATLAAKKTAVSRFLQFLWNNGCQKFCHLNTGIVSRALLIFENHDDYSRVRSFLSFLADRNMTDLDLSGIVPWHRRKKVLPTVYTVEEIKRAEKAIDTSSEAGRRDLAIVLLAARMGLRAGDIAKLRLDEIDLSTGYLQIIQEKTLVPLTLQMPDEVISAIKTYLDNQSNKAADGYVFHSLSAPYGKVTSSIIRHAVNNSLSVAGIDTSGRKHGPHAFRSSLASSMVNDGASYETVRRILGHTDPDVIKHYARTDIENLRLCAIEPPPPSGLFEEYLSGKEVAGHV